MQRLWKEYYRAEEVAKDLEARHAAIFEELSELRLDGNRLLKEAHELQELSLDSALSPAAREDKKRSFDLKLADFRAFELRFDETKTQRETEFQSQLVRANRRVSEEIFSITRALSEREGFNLVLNASKTNPNTEVVFTKNVADLTDRVLASLNATKPVIDNTEPKKAVPKSQ